MYVYTIFMYIYGTRISNIMFYVVETSERGFVKQTPTVYDTRIE